MAVTHQPIFTQTPKIGVATISAANTARDGSGTIVTLATIGANGGLLKRVTFTSAQATAAASAAMVGRVWLSIDSGTTWYLRAEIAIATATASNTVVGATNYVSFGDGLPLPIGAVVGVTQSVRGSAADDMDVIADFGDY